MCIKFEGYFFREESYWPVCVPALEIHSQGKTRKDALGMIQEAVVLSVDQKGFQVIVEPFSQNKFILRSRNKDHDRYLIALMLKNQRAKHGLSIQDVADRLGVTKNAYAQYEQARSIPSITKVEEFIHAMSKKTHVVLDILDESKAA